MTRMIEKITASSKELMDQAPMTAHTYFHQAIKSIDEKFGTGYAQKHPELVGAFIQTAAYDFQASVIAQAIQFGMTEISDAVAAKSTP